MPLTEYPVTLCCKNYWESNWQKSIQQIASYLSCKFIKLQAEGTTNNIPINSRVLYGSQRMEPWKGVNANELADNRSWRSQEWTHGITGECSFWNRSEIEFVISASHEEWKIIPLSFSVLGMTLITENFVQYMEIWTQHELSCRWEVHMIVSYSE